MQLPIINLHEGFIRGYTRTKPLFKAIARKEKKWINLFNNHIIQWQIIEPMWKQYLC